MTVSRLPTAAVLALALCAVVTVGAGTAQADPGRGPRGAGPVPRGVPTHDRREEHRALADAVRRVERATGGEVLSAERVQSDGRDISRVKVVDSSGRVRVYMDDPQAPRGARRTRGDDGDSD